MELSSRLGIKPNGLANGASAAQGMLCRLQFYSFIVRFIKLLSPQRSIESDLVAHYTVQIKVICG